MAQKNDSVKFNPRRYSYNERTQLELELRDRFQEVKLRCAQIENRHEFKFAFSYLSKSIIDHCRIEEVLKIEPEKFYKEYLGNGLLLEAQRAHKSRFDRVVLSLLRHENVFAPPWEDIYQNTFTITYKDRFDNTQTHSILRKCSIVLTKSKVEKTTDVIGQIETWSINGAIKPFIVYDLICSDAESRKTAIIAFIDKNKQYLFGTARPIPPGSELLLLLLNEGYTYAQCDAHLEFKKYGRSARSISDLLFERLPKHAGIDVSKIPGGEKEKYIRATIESAKILGLLTEAHFQI